MIRNILVALTALWVALPTRAQLDTRTDTIFNPDGSYTIHTQSVARKGNANEANKVWQLNAWNAHWFASLQAGATVYMGQEDTKGKFGKRITPLYEITVGKWIYPFLGVRLSLGQGSLTGFSTKRYEQIGSGYCQEPPVEAPDADGQGGLWKQHWPFRSVHMDLLYDLGSKRNYNPNSFYHCKAVLGMGINWDHKYQYKNDRNRIAAFYLGLNHTFRLNQWLELACDTRYVIANETFDRERTHGGVPGYANVSLGLTWNITPKKQEPKSPIWYYTHQNTRYTDVNDTYTEYRSMGEHKVQPAKANVTPAVVYFDCDKYNLLPEYQLTLQLVAKQMKESGCRLMLIGSADSETSNPTHNQWLSEQRCLTVKNYLVNACHIPADRLIMKPLGGTDTYIPAHLNRTVFICAEGDENALKEVKAITKQSHNEHP